MTTATRGVGACSRLGGSSDVFGAASAASAASIGSTRSAGVSGTAGTGHRCVRADRRPIQRWARPARPFVPQTTRRERRDPVSDPASPALSDDATTPPANGPASPPAPSAEPRQRWRLTFARGPDPTRTAHRDLATDWLARLRAVGLSLASGGRARQPLSFAASLPVGIAAERELADLVLADRLPVSAARAAVVASLPPGLQLLDVHDVWLGEPPIAAAVGGADYRLTLGDGDARVGAEQLASAARALLAEPSIPWLRSRGGGMVDVDLRPLLERIELVGERPLSLGIRVRIHPERGSGRPDEIVGALAKRLGRELEIEEIVRERVLLADEMTAGGE